MRIRDYEIEGVLGEGGMGRVYAARHVRLDEPIALKELRLDDPELAKQFLVEARVLYTIRHPCFPTVKDCFVADGRHYLVMDRIAGRDLQSSIVQRGHIDVDAMGWIVDQLLEGLSYLHARRVFHRDIKPANVMVDFAAQRAVLVDFGIARARAVALKTSAFARGALTPRFAPPEQYRGEPCDAASDLYALGATIDYALTGTLPPEAIARFGRDPRTPLAARVPGLSPARAQSVDAALVLDRAQRTQSADEWRAQWHSAEAPTTSPRALDTYKRLRANDIRRRT